MSYHRDTAPLATIQAQPDRPILLAHGCVLTRDATLGDWADADVLIGSGKVVGIGPGLESAAGDDGMIVIDCRGCIVMPSGSGALVPAEAADIIVCRVIDPANAVQVPTLDRPNHIDIQFEAGVATIWAGAAVEGATIQAASRLTLINVRPDDPRLGLWSDERGFLRQRLLPNGRYDEARGEQESAYQGRYWIDGDRIDYLDDLGFWAFGTFFNDRLEHAGYTLRWSK